MKEDNTFENLLAEIFPCKCKNQDSCLNEINRHRVSSAIREAQESALRGLATEVVYGSIKAKEGWYIPVSAIDQTIAELKMPRIIEKATEQSNKVQNDLLKGGEK